MRSVSVLWLCGVVLVGGPAQADLGTDVPPAYVVASNDNGIPPELLYAVASAESAIALPGVRRPWPWTLNVAGQGMRFVDRASACSALRDALERTRSVDVGIAQLNVRWQTHLFGPGGRFADPCDALDPYSNLDEAARLLRGHYDATRDWLAAAGRYHRPAGGAPAARYRGIVRRELARLSTTLPQFLQSEVVLTSRTSPSKSVAASGDHELIWVTPEDDDVAWVNPSLPHARIR